MSCAIVSVVYGVPLTEKVSKKIQEWESEGDERWTDDKEGQCGFTTLYSASGGDMVGFCGVELCELKSYGNQKISELKLTATVVQKNIAVAKVKELDHELKKLAGDIDVYLIWHDS